MMKEDSGRAMYTPILVTSRIQWPILTRRSWGEEINVEIDETSGSGDFIY